MATAVYASATNNAEIDGLLSGVKWSGSITYSFPDSPSDYPASYYGNGEPTGSGFTQAPSQMQTAIVYAVGLINSYTNANISYAGTNGADIMVAQSPAANPTSYAYYPSSYASGGDIWFGTGYNYSLASLGNYYFATALHELGHAIGLKHSQETGGVANVAVPSAHDDSEYTVMSYRSYVGAPLTGYTAESYGFSQTYMANDILAMQTMYGANYNTQSGNTVYTWNATTGQMSINGVGQAAPGGGGGGSANRIFETIWDGNGVDTYDLSNYTTNLSLNLNPGASSTFSSTQIAYLGNGYYASGNVYNAYLYNNDARSYIDNATGGSGNDSIIGNAIANVLNGGSGNDTLRGNGGNDSIIGGSGTDTAVYSGNKANYGISYNSTTQVFTLVDLRSGTPDGTDTVSGVENFQFADGTISSTLLTSPGVAIESFGVTSLVQYGSVYALNSVAGGFGPEVTLNGSPLTAGQFAGWSPVAAEKTTAGYQLAMYASATNQFIIWTLDNNGSYVTNSASMSGTSTALEIYENSFHQDLNGDGTVGIPSSAGTVIEAAGATKLVQVGSNYFLNAVSGGSGPEVFLNGSPLAAGQFAGWAPVAAEKTSAGYQLAMYSGAANQFIVWSLDNNGSYLTNTAVMSGTSPSLQGYETTFQQDLNGDGTIGSPASTGTTVESAGVTKLVQVGSNYFMMPVAGGAGVEVMLNNSPLTAGQFAGWSPTAAEKTSSGYQLAMHSAGSDQFIIWTLDNNGNYLTNTAAVSGTSATLKSYESGFQQDLNGDGVISAASSGASIANSSALSSSAFVFEAGTANAGDNHAEYFDFSLATSRDAMLDALASVHEASHDAGVHQVMDAVQAILGPQSGFFFH